MLRDAIAKLDQQSAQWQGTLKQLADKLMAEGKQALANEVTQLMQRGIGTGGAELRCDIDFVGKRMKQGLERILARLEGKPQPPIEPALCVVSPTFVDMARRPAQVEFYGYDLDASDGGGLRAFLRHDGGEEPLDRWFNRITHYLVAVTVAETSDVPLCNKENRQIILRYGGREFSSVQVVKKLCPGPPPQAQSRDLPGFPVEWGFGGGVFGARELKQFGGACSVGYVRHQCRAVVIEQSGNAGCPEACWTPDPNKEPFPHCGPPDDNVRDCHCWVRFWADAFQGVKCQIQITEVGEPKPAPPCPCW